MKRFRLAAIALIAPLGALAPLGAAASAQAAGQMPFTISEQITLGPGGPVLETFTATGPLCHSGTFADTVLTSQPDNSQGPDHGKLILIVRSVYTCADGSGTFNAQKELVGTPGPDDTATSTGPIQLLGGTGAFTNLIGHGTDTGKVNADNTADANDVGVVVRI
jgi:hypothetical protein